MPQRIPAYLLSDCKRDPCYSCVAPVKFGETGWFITMGHPGFNSPTNNCFGYKTKEKAIAAYRHYASKGGRRV